MSLEWKKKLVPYRFVWAMIMKAYASVSTSCQSYYHLAVEKRPGMSDLLEDHLKRTSVPALSAATIRPPVGSQESREMIS